MLTHIPVWPNWQGVSLLRSEVEVRILPPERTAAIQEVVAVNPWGHGPIGRAAVLHTAGWGFESP